jgi:cytokinin dehydrogenase
MGLKVSMRGQGHAMFGQTQVDAGVVIDSNNLNSVRIINSGGRPVVEAGPGTLWGPVLDTAYVNNLTPPVNVDPTYLSFVGGTISTGGFGGISWREGFQVDHVRELQVVTGDGQLLTCSDERNSDLFNAALAGMGQCGIIVNVVLALVPAPTHVLFFVLNYADLQTTSADLTFLVKDGRFNHLDVRTTAQPGDGFTFNIEGGAFYDAPNTPSKAQLLAGLRFTSRTARVMTYVQYYCRQEVCVATPPVIPLLARISIRRVCTTPAEVAFAFPRFSAWRRSSINVRSSVCRTKIWSSDSNFRAIRQHRPTYRP